MNHILPFIKKYKTAAIITGCELVCILGLWYCNKISFVLLDYYAGDFIQTNSLLIITVFFLAAAIVFLKSNRLRRRLVESIFLLLCCFSIFHNLSGFKSINTGSAFPLTTDAERSLPELCRAHPNKMVQGMYVFFLLEKYYAGKSLVTYSLDALSSNRYRNMWIYYASKFENVSIESYPHQLSADDIHSLKNYSSIRCRGPFKEFVLITDEQCLESSRTVRVYTHQGTSYLVPDICMRP